MSDSGESDIYEVDKIVGKKIGDDGEPLYRVRWKNYQPSEDTWEPMSHLMTVIEEVEKYESKHVKLPQKRARPSKVRDEVEAITPKRSKVEETKPAKGEEIKSDSQRKPLGTKLVEAAEVPRSYKNSIESLEEKKQAKSKKTHEDQVPKSKLTNHRVQPKKPHDPKTNLSNKSSDPIATKPSPASTLNTSKSADRSSGPPEATTDLSSPMAVPRGSIPEVSIAAVLQTQANHFRGLKVSKANLEEVEVAEIIGCRQIGGNVSWFVSFKPRNGEVYVPQEFTSLELKKTFPIHYSRLMFDALCLQLG